MINRQRLIDLNIFSFHTGRKKYQLACEYSCLSSLLPTRDAVLRDKRGSIGRLLVGVYVFEKLISVLNLVNKSLRHSVPQHSGKYNPCTDNHYLIIFKHLALLLPVMITFCLLAVYYDLLYIYFCSFISSSYCKIFKFSFSFIFLAYIWDMTYHKLCKVDKVLKVESSRKLSNFTFQWTKTLYQNNLKNITFSFTIFKG